jgi:L-serine deaminase
MTDELQEKLRNMNKPNPVDEVIKTMLKTDAKCCVKAKVRLEELKKDHEKK